MIFSWVPLITIIRVNIENISYKWHTVIWEYDNTTILPYHTAKFLGIMLHERIKSLPSNAREQINNEQCDICQNIAVGQTTVSIIRVARLTSQSLLTTNTGQETSWPKCTFSQKNKKVLLLFCVGKAHQPALFNRDRQAHQPTLFHRDRQAHQPTLFHHDRQAHQPTLFHRDRQAHQPALFNRDRQAHQPALFHHDRQAHQPTLFHRDRQAHQPTLFHHDRQAHQPTLFHRDRQAHQPALFNRDRQAHQPALFHHDRQAHQPALFHHDRQAHQPALFHRDRQAHQPTLFNRDRQAKSLFNHTLCVTSVNLLSSRRSLTPNIALIVLYMPPRSPHISHKHFPPNKTAGHSTSETNVVYWVVTKQP